MYNKLFVYTIFIGIIITFQNSWYAKGDVLAMNNGQKVESTDGQETDVNVRTAYTKRNETHQYGKAVESTCKQEAEIQDQGRTRILNKRSRMSSEDDTECPERRENGIAEMKYMCPSSLCQHMQYRCDIDCPGSENEQSCKLNSCTGLRYCLSKQQGVDLPLICRRSKQKHCHRRGDESRCAEPCPPMCMCIGLSVNFSHVDTNFSFNGSYINTSGNDPRFPIFLRLSAIRYLVLTDITTITENFFSGLHDLVLLDISSSELSRLTGHQFCQLISLVTLKLPFNELSYLPDTVFDCLSNLESLDLSKNKITFLQSKLFSKLISLTKLDLSHNRISNLPENIFKGLTNLRELLLSDNSFTDLPSNVFSGIPNLAVLAISNNEIEVIPDNAFANLSLLKYFRANGNKITHIQNNTFIGLRRLKVLGMSDNRIEILSGEAFEAIPELNFLDLSRNKILVIPDTVFSTLCKLEILLLRRNMIAALTENVFSGLHKLMYIYLERNRISAIAANVFNDLDALRALHMAYNKITNLPDNVFSGLSKLINLDLSRNRISAIPDNIFRDLNKLKFLSLPGNKIRSIASKGFFGLHNIDYINLDENELTNLHSDVFAGLPHLYFLDLSSNRLTELHEKVFLGITGRIFLKLDHNKLRTIPMLPHNIKLLDVSENLITSLPVGIFSNCSKLYLLNLIGNEIEITRDIFQGLDDLRYLITGNPTMCCIKPKSVTDEKCLALEQLGTDCLERAVSCPIAKSDAISSCTNLIGSDVLRVFLWIIGLCALLGNIVVIAYRVFIDRDNFKNTYSLFVLNLGISDLLMGIYLLIIGIADAYYQGVYAWYDQFWRRSIFCTIGGVLSFISSEMSTFLILLVTLDRLIVIVLPLSHLSKWRISWIQAILISVFFWTFSIILSILPIVSFQSYFEGKFYSQAGVCLALPLLGDEQPGAEYSFAVFVCLNSFVFGIIVVGQICILKTIRMKTRNIASSVTIKRERTVAKTLFLVVASDFCCWFPVGILGLLARCGIPISNEAYAWVIVFVLPINAAVNPFLYTVTSFLRKRQREQYIASMTSTKLLRRQPETVVVESTAQ